MDDDHSSVLYRRRALSPVSDRHRACQVGDGGSSASRAG
jgi:hypothetical protein